jgi:UDP-glucose 4-epimerase
MGYVAMPDPFEMYRYIEQKIIDNIAKRSGQYVVNNNQGAEPSCDPERRSGEDRRRKCKYIPAQVVVHFEGTEMIAVGGTATATKDGTTVNATGVVIKKD